MGVDCTIYSQSGHEHLDRWDVFSEVFGSAKIIGRSDALARLRGMPNGDKYSAHWAKAAIDFIESSGDEQFSFVNESDPIDDDLFEAAYEAKNNQAAWKIIVDSQKEEA